MKQYYKSSLFQQHVCKNQRSWAKIKLIYALLFIFFAKVNQRVLAQQEKSVTNLIVAASQEERVKLSADNANKLAKIEQSTKYKLVQLVKVGNLAKIQKKGVLIFAIPGSGERFIYYAKKVDAQSESEFTWVGVSADQLYTAIFICKKGQLSATFSFSGRSFQLYSINRGFSVLVEDRTDLDLKCEVEGSA